MRFCLKPPKTKHHQQNHKKTLSHLTQSRKGIKKKTNDNKIGENDKIEAFTLWVKFLLVQPPWKYAWRLLKKLNLETTYDPAILLPYKHQKFKSVSQQTIWTSTFIEALLKITEIWNLARYSSTNEWIETQKWNSSGAQCLDYEFMKKLFACGPAVTGTGQSYRWT